MGRLSLSSRLQTILQPRMKFGLPPAPAPHLAAKFYHGTVSIGSSVASDPLTFVCLRIMDYVSLAYNLLHQYYVQQYQQLRASLRSAGMDSYILTTYTFGTKCSSSLRMYVHTYPFLAIIGIFNTDSFE